MTSVDRVSLGDQNKQRANAPPGSKPQLDIILHMSDGVNIRPVFFHYFN